MKIILIASTISLLMLSACAQTETQSPEGEAIEKYVQDWTNKAYYGEIQVSELEFVQDITAMDSAKLLTDKIQAIRNNYDQLNKEINATIKLRDKAKTHLYYDNSDKINPHYQNKVNGYTSQLKKVCENMNKFIDASRGISNPGETYNVLFKEVLSVSSNSSGQVVLGKVYKATVQYYKSRSGGADKKIETYYFILDSEGKRVVSHEESFSIPEKALSPPNYSEKFSVNESGDLVMVPINQ